MFQSEGRNVTKNASTQLPSPKCAQDRPLEAGLPTLLIVQGFYLVLAALSCSSDSVQGRPVHQEEGVTDAALLRHDERYESEEVGGKLARGPGTTVPAAGWG